MALPYREGTTSGVLKLALAFGKPVIATTVGDFVEQVPQGGGILVQNDTSGTKGFINAIDVIRGHHQSYAGVMKHAQKNADWSAIALKVVQHLERVPLGA